MRTRRHSGFTLIELMIVVAIVAILAAIALPSFAQQMRKSRRSEAISSMQSAQLALERWRVDHADHTTGNPGATITNSTHYTFAVASADANSYTITATPQGDQAKDSCGTLKIVNNAGTLSKTADTTGCW